MGHRRGNRVTLFSQTPDVGDQGFVGPHVAEPLLTADTRTKVGLHGPVGRHRTGTGKEPLQLHFIWAIGHQWISRKHDVTEYGIPTTELSAGGCDHAGC